MTDQPLTNQPPRTRRRGPRDSTLYAPDNYPECAACGYVLASEDELISGLCLLCAGGGSSAKTAKCLSNRHAECGAYWCECRCHRRGARNGPHVRTERQ